MARPDGHLKLKLLKTLKVDHRHSRVREPKMPEDFVVHSLRHTMLTRFGLHGAFPAPPCVGWA